MIARHSHKHLFDLQTFPFKLDSSLPKGSIFSLLIQVKESRWTCKPTTHMVKNR